MLQIRRQEDGSYVVSVRRHDVGALDSLPLRLRELLESPEANAGIITRLFPRAYSDKKKEAEYRDLLGEDLLKRKLLGIRAFEKTLRNRKRRGRHVDIMIAQADFDLWLCFVNDMRLVLSMELDIQDEGWGSSFDPDHPRAPDLALLHYLSWLEEELLAAATVDGKP